MKFITLHLLSNKTLVYINVEAIEAICEGSTGKGACVMVKSHNNGGFQVDETPREVMLLSTQGR